MYLYVLMYVYAAKHNGLLRGMLAIELNIDR